MIEISLCMIVKNEEAVIGRCLDSVEGLFDEIIIVDTGSTDATCEIAEKYTDKIYHFEWIDDFSAARNYSFSLATRDYIMWLDADDVLSKKDKIKMQALKETLDPSVNMVLMKYDIAFDEEGNPAYSYYRERLFQRSMDYHWVDPIHEVIPLSGSLLYADIAISHKKLNRNDPGRNLRIYEKMLAEGQIFQPRQQYYYARELYYNEKYDEAVEQYEAFLKEGSGWVENSISACQELAACYRALNHDQDALQALMRSFIYDIPRPELCCDIGRYFLDKSQYGISVFWYELALQQKPDLTDGGFHTADSYGYLPHIQLCVCYDRLGNREKAISHNEKAAEYHPNDPSVLHNRSYFESLQEVPEAHDSP